MSKMFVALSISAAALVSLVGLPNATAQTPTAAQAKFVAMLKTTRAPTIYASPDTLPRFGYSYAVVVNNWTRPIDLGFFYPSDTSGDLTAQTRSMLGAIEKKLADLGVTKGRIIRTSVLIKGTRFQDTLTVTDLLDGYFADRKLMATARPETFDFPVRNVANMTELDRPGVLVAMDVTILDPATSPDDLIVKGLTTQGPPPPAITPKGARTFLIEAVTAQKADFSLEGRNANEQLTSSLKHLDQVLAQIGAKRADIAQLAVDFVPSDNISERDITPRLAAYFGNNTPKVSFRSVGMSAIPGPSACVSAEGAVIYQ
jgi:enamine deaminase RidA (YjgF/YER057c/UK114 family)